MLQWNNSTHAFACGTAGSGGGTTINSTNNLIPVRSNSTTFVDSPLTVAGSGVTGSVTNSTQYLGTDGNGGNNPTYSFASASTTGMFRGANGIAFNISGGYASLAIRGSRIQVPSTYAFGWVSGADPTGSSTGPDTAFSRVSANVAQLGSDVGDASGQLNLAKLKATTAIATATVVTSALPTCTASTGIPWRASVSDAVTPALGVVLTGGGLVFANVHCSLTTGTYLVDGL
jgi:hypothetical protein